MPLARFALFLLVLAFLPVAAPAKPVTLAAALAAVRPPEGEIVLAVAAEKTRLPAGEAPPAGGASVNETAAAFGRITQDFGPVTAVAPPTMTLLNTAPGTPNIYADLPPDDAFKLLAATLSPAQWKELTGAQGLGQDNLTSDTQRSLFLAQFPGGVLHVAPEHDPLSGPERAEPSQDLSADLPHARLRLGQEVQILLPSPEHPNSFYGIGPEPYDPAHHDLVPQGGTPEDTLYGVQTHQEVPNAPKAGELDFDRTVLRKSIPLDGVKTVGDLVARIGFECKTELYADRRYEGRTVTLMGGRSASARRLLQALAFCLTGTFRRVGPAYVLTDDVLGLGTRRQILAEFERQAQELRRRPLDAAGDALVTAHSPDDLSNAGPLALSPAQVKQARQESPVGYGPRSVQMPFSALTPAQQQAARREIALFDEHRDHYVVMLKEGDSLTLDGKIQINFSPKLELILPSLAEPVAINSGPSLDALFRPSDEMQNKMSEASAAQKAVPAPTAPKPAPPLAGLLRTIPHRAVLVSLKTPAEVDALIASMKKVGLNELWLDVFSEGACRVPVPSGAIGAGITPLPVDAGDVLAEAVRATRGSGIRVFAALDLLAWGAKTPADIQERTILGETGKEADARLGAQAMLFPGADVPTTVAVSPFAPPVQAALGSLMRSLAARPGLAGIVWRETAPPGYEEAGEGQTGPEFGYAEAARLAFLRRAHMDPLDIPLQNEGPKAGQINPSLPEFRGAGGETALSAEWDKFRLEGDVLFLRGLADLWARGGARRPILVRQRRATWDDDWFGSWDGPAKPLPVHHSSWELRDSGLSYPEASDAQAKMTSQTALLRLSSGAASSPDALAEELTRALVGKRWDGFVLDLTPDVRFGNPPPAAGENPLAGLTPKPVPAAK